MADKVFLQKERDCENCQLRTIIKEQEKMIKELEKRLTKYENAHTPPSCLKYPSNPPSDFDPKKPGRPVGHEGTTRHIPIPDKIVKVKAKTCPNCQTQLGEPTKIEFKTIEEIPEPQPVRVTEYQIAHYNCPHCKREVIASSFDIPSCGGRFGKNLLSKVVLLKYSERLPHRRIAEVLKRDHGLYISPGAIFEITNRTAQSLSLEWIKIAKKLRKRKAVNVDETGIKVNRRNYWIWIFTTNKETLVAIRKSRGCDVPKEVLGKDFKGIIITDGWRAYLNFTKRIQRCWAHILREAKFIAHQVKEAIPLKEALFRIYKSFNNLSPPEEERPRLYRNAIQRLRYWLFKKEWKEERVLKFIGKLKRALNYFFTFILHPEAEPTNNRAERGLREHVVIRKIIGTLRNEKGTRIHEIITSVLTTWKQRGFNVNEMLNYTLGS